MITSPGECQRVLYVRGETGACTAGMKPGLIHEHMAMIVHTEGDSK